MLKIANKQIMYVVKANVVKAHTIIEQVRTWNCLMFISIIDDNSACSS